MIEQKNIKEETHVSKSDFELISEYINSIDANIDKNYSDIRDELRSK